MNLISYVVDHDTGFAPNPFFGECILSHCKYSKDGKRRNVIEIAESGTWIAGTGGAKLQKNGRLIYAMKVEAKLPISELFSRKAFSHRRKAFGYKHGCGQHDTSHGEWMLVADEFYYFGQNAIPIPNLLQRFRNQRGTFEGLEKRGPGHKSRFSFEFIQSFENWIRKYDLGLNGLPHHLHQGTRDYLKEIGEVP